MSDQIKFMMVIFIATLVFTGCGGGGSPATPDIGLSEPQANTAQAGNSRMLWGFFSIEIDPATLEAEIVPFRTADFGANVTKFLQPPASPVSMLSLTVDTANSDLPNDLVALDLTIRHPFPGLNQFRGFDVRGIFMSDGSQTARFDSTLIYANWSEAEPSIPTSEPVLLNADGYTRWWNPTEFL